MLIVDVLLSSEWLFLAFYHSNLHGDVGGLTTEIQIFPKSPKSSQISLNLLKSPFTTSSNLLSNLIWLTRVGETHQSWENAPWTPVGHGWRCLTPVPSSAHSFMPTSLRGYSSKHRYDSNETLCSEKSRRNRAFFSLWYHFYSRQRCTQTYSY